VSVAVGLGLAEGEADGDAVGVLEAVAVGETLTVADGAGVADVVAHAAVAAAADGDTPQDDRGLADGFTDGRGLLVALLALGDGVAAGVRWPPVPLSEPPPLPPPPCVCPTEMTDEPSWTKACRTGAIVRASVATNATAAPASAGRSHPTRLGGGAASACRGACTP